MAAPSNAGPVQGHATTVHLLDRACQSADDIVCQAATTCLQHVWRETSRIVLSWLKGCQTFADLMDGMRMPNAASSRPAVAMAHFQELVRRSWAPAGSQQHMSFAFTHTDIVTHRETQLKCRPASHSPANKWAAWLQLQSPSSRPHCGSSNSAGLVLRPSAR